MVLDQEKTNALLDLIKVQDSNILLTRIISMQKNLSELNYEFLVKRREDAGIKHLNDSNAFIE